MEQEVNKFVYWIPRILSIIFILFLAFFSLDVFETGLSFWQTIGALFMHNIPSFVLLAVVLISWKYEIVGGIVFILFGILYITILAIIMFKSLSFQWNFLSWSLMIAGPAFIIGILFLIGWFKKRKLLQTI